MVKQTRKHCSDPIRYETGGHTRQCLNISEGSSGKQFRLVLPDPIWTSTQVDGFLARILEHTETDALVIVSGSMSPALPMISPSA
ncbi:MAG: hypothetical protein ABGW81_08185 [Paracoccaceae bacterium]